MNDLTVAGILVVLIACLISYHPYAARIEEKLDFDDAPVMRISETFDTEFRKISHQEPSVTAYFDSRLQGPDSLVTMELRNEELEDAFALLAREAGIPILTAGPVEGRVSLSVSDATLERVLEMLTLPYGCDFVWQEEQILVGPISTEPSTYSKISYTVILKPRFASAKDIHAALSDVYAPYIRTHDEFLFVTAPFSILKRIQEDIAKLDVSRRQIALDIMVLKIPVKIHPELDVEFTADYLVDYPFEALSKRLGFEEFEGAGTDGGLVDSLVSKATVPLYAFARTRVVVDEGVESHIYLKWSFTDPSSITQQTKLDSERKDLTTLIFKGHTIDDDNIVFRVSLPYTTDDFQGEALENDNSFLSLVSSRDIPVGSGDLVVVSGLLEDEEIVKTSHIPVLGDLPVLGRLFHWSHLDYSDMEIVIIVKPTILAPR